MKSKTISFLFMAGTFMGVLPGCSSANSKDKQDSPRKTDWVWLYDGSSTDAWRGTVSDSFPTSGWMQKGNELIVLGKTDSTEAGTDIITKKEYGNFELILEFKVTEHANSGIKYFVSNKFPGHKGEYLGLEYQILDDKSYTTAELGDDRGNHLTGSLYDLIPAPEQKKMYPAGQWNEARIVVDGNHIEHWLNGEKLVECERGSEQFRTLVAKSKYKKLKDFGELSQGHIMLQGHSTEVAFRNVKIRS